MSKCQSRVELDGLRKNILEAAFKAQEGHIPSAFSILEIVYGFYNRFHKEQLMIEGKKHHFILSKGHGSLALYAVLSHFGIISEDWKYTFASASSEYGGHPDSNKITGVEVSSGSLGHGLPIALGIALGKRIKKEDGRVYVLVGDGEINEGSNWESFLLLGKFNLRNLVVVVDCNDSGERALPLGSLSKKLEGFNLEVSEIDGHSEEDVSRIYSKNSTSKTPLYLARTIKGKGISEMEGNPAWHHKYPSEDELNRFLEELS